MTVVPVFPLRPPPPVPPRTPTVNSHSAILDLQSNCQDSTERPPVPRTQFLLLSPSYSRMVTVHEPTQRPTVPSGFFCDCLIMPPSCSRVPARVPSHGPSRLRHCLTCSLFLVAGSFEDDCSGVLWTIPQLSSAWFPPSLPKLGQPFCPSVPRGSVTHSLAQSACHPGASDRPGDFFCNSIP